jgi:hypothetical protein
MTQGIVRPSACLDPETLGTLAEGRLTGAARDAAVRHLATCRRCHEVFASSVQILDGEGVLPALPEQAAAPAPVARPPVMLWLSAAAAALVSAVVFVQRAPVQVQRMAQASPSPVVTAPVATASPTPPAVQAASLPPEAIEALRTLKGFELPYAVPPAVGFAPDPRKAEVRKGVADVDAVARTLSPRSGVADRPDAQPALPDAVEPWRRVGRILEASRLALAAPPGTAAAFFASPWTRSELSQASARLREAGVADTAWADDVRRVPLDDAAGEKLLDRLDALLAELS